MSGKRPDWLDTEGNTDWDAYASELDEQRGVDTDGESL